MEKQVNERLLLLVEDNPGDADYIGELLEHHSGQDRYRLIHATRLAEAVKLLRSMSFDVVLLDLQLPDGTGTETLQAVQAESVGTPIVVLTGTDDEELALACIAAGAQDYLCKDDIQPVSLRRALGYAISRVLVIRNIRDREARRDAEAKAMAAEHSLDLFKHVLESMPIGVRLLRWEDPGDFASFRLEWQNEAAKRAGADESEGSGRVARDRFPDPLRNGAAVVYASAIRSGAPQSLPDIHLGGGPKAGSIYSAQAAPLQEDLVGVFYEEITERARLAEQLRQAQKMEAIGRLAGGVAHDFNNLLTAIVAFAGMARKRLADGDATRDDIDEVLNAADRASRLTKQLLAFSRRQIISPELVDLNRLVTDISRMLRRTIGEHIHLVMRPGKALWPVHIDTGQFQQVVMNLAINARDAMPDGGRLTIETRNGDAAESELGDHVVLRVTDTGIGMREDVTAQIFEPFFTTKEEGKGTGLGLSMVYGLVTQAGGRISVRSQPGKGTAFEIHLPRSTRKPAERTPAPGALAKRQGTETILVVEDDSTVRKAAGCFLTESGYTVLEASDGRKAMALFDELGERVDLVLTDVVMPGMSGSKLVAELRAKNPQLKALFMTGYASDTSLQGSAVEQDVEVIAKPFTEEELVIRVRRILDQGIAVEA